MIERSATSYIDGWRYRWTVRRKRWSLRPTRGRYKASYDIPALIPQVYLHYDPYNQRTRRSLSSGTPLARQRMDFLLLFSDRQRVVIEVDGKQHYAQ